MKFCDDTIKKFINKEKVLLKTSKKTNKFI